MISGHPASATWRIPGGLSWDIRRILGHVAVVGGPGSVRPEEVEVLRMHTLGLSDAAIARRLGVSLTTVRRRALRARERCGARTRVEAVAMLVAAGRLRVSTSGHEDRGQGS